ncbi:hypothetical protein NL676_025015 [Syzygium grande]|nr:hypothetical protein NL676_025015 [Syzygium grande]
MACTRSSSLPARSTAKLGLLSLMRATSRPLGTTCSKSRRQRTTTFSLPDGISEGEPPVSSTSTTALKSRD